MFRLLVLLIGLLLPRFAAASLDAAALCEAATAQVAAETGVPHDILAAVALTETGRRRGGAVRPWAWSVNAAGQGSWFDDPQSALALAEERIRQGRPNVDLGCFQINYRWHGEHFSSLGAMLDPLTNARYAARFLSDLHAETGDWRAAAGAFHSRSPAMARRYLARFDELRSVVMQGGGGAEAPETYNRFAAASGGSDPFAGGSWVTLEDLIGEGGPPREVPVPDVHAVHAPVDIALGGGGMEGVGFPDPSGRRAPRVRDPRTILGAVAGTEAEAQAGSLAPLGQPARMLFTGPAAPLIGGAQTVAVASAEAQGDARGRPQGSLWH
ncbi:hypothetical protein GI374_10445 [Paracoccus sp. S-4012]|uniref:hypothetical protein n=1 Tax=Paracoccus sp. S-4012 TaxID=2665648 RepID=UPI0012B0450E|nr:hypothetical protein [Paracoccus sp. S-4012]MRX50858.1 hypothetical protein [Paracoccus sp. S-4012]